MFVKFTLFALDCHWIAPVLPLNVRTVLFVPEHIVVAPEIVPATEVGFTVIVALAVLADAHAPLVTKAL
jgi:hypothetical protein